MIEEPYPCPFCNEIPTITAHFKYKDLFSLTHRCKLVGPITIDWRDRQSILDAWNTRSGIPRYAG